MIESGRPEWTRTIDLFRVKVGRNSASVTYGRIQARSEAFRGDS
jgi:hypothetical protein